MSSYRYVSRPVVISAVPVGHLLDDAVYLENLPMWVYTARSSGVWEYHNDGIRVYTLEGTMFAGPTDMLIRGTKGELYPCKLDIFNTKYAPCES